MKNETWIDLSKAVVVCPEGMSAREQKAVTVLLEEVEKRTRLQWRCVHTWPAGSGAAVAVLPRRLLATVAPGVTVKGDGKAAEGFSVRSDGAKKAVYIIGNDERGVLFGVGWLLRHLRLETTSAAVAAGLDVATAPHYRLRGHQVSYRDKVNSYDGWDVPQFEQYIRDLAIFGSNCFEMIPPRSDDKDTSVHFPRPPLEMMAKVSQVADEYGIDVWLWYPAMDDDYSDPATVEFALKEWGEVLGALPRVDAILVPGGDPGNTPPRLLFPMLAKQAAQLKKIHPNAQWWVAPQGFSQAWMDDFLSIVRDEQPAWLTGVVHGPWVHMTMPEFRKLIPERYPIRNYPDITHTLACQFPVPDWDIACALTIGREPVNPRPIDEAIVFHAMQPGTIGFIAYCEGCHDDVNKIVWSGLGWDPDQPVIDILREYSRYFIGERYTDDFAQGLLALERNWRGPVAANSGITTTLQQFQAMEAAASPWTLKNWRFQQALYRAYYDAYVRGRLLYEKSLEEQAMDVLRGAERSGAALAMMQAEAILDRAVLRPINIAWRTRVHQLAEALFQSPAHMQLSVHLYQGQEEVRGANLDGLDYPLNDRPWLKARFGEIRAMDTEQQRLASITQIVEWTNPGPGGFYDDLGSSVAQPHVVKGNYAQDPGYTRSALHWYPYRKDPRPIKLAWRGYTGALNDATLQMHYDNLDPRARYCIRIVYSEMSPEIKVRLDAGKHEVHPWLLKPVPRLPVEFDIPQEATKDGTLTLTWRREPGHGHAGRGCDLSEVWLVKVT